MAKDPLSNIHLQSTYHISSTKISTTTLKTGTTKSPKEIGPKADSEADIDVRAAAAMCQYAYGKLSPKQSPVADLIDGWKPMSPNEVNTLMGPGFNQKLRNPFSGFSSMLFQKQVDGVRYYAFCTVGTDELIDWVSNATQFFTGLSDQHTYSVQIAKQLDKTIGSKAVLWFIGHSLGGGLASNNSLVTGRHAITFNAAGLNMFRTNATLVLNNWKDLFHPIARTKRVHAFIIQGEILNSFLAPFLQGAYGTRHSIKFDRPGKSPLDKHALTNFLDKWNMKYH